MNYRPYRSSSLPRLSLPWGRRDSNPRRPPEKAEMPPLQNAPRRDTLCQGMRWICCIETILERSSAKESGRPDSNRRSQAPRACGVARLSHALSEFASSSCGNRTHLSALKGQYPRPIDERAIERGRRTLESPSAGLQPAAGPFQRPTRSADETKRPGVVVTPGLRLRARDVRGQASRPQGIERERARRLFGGSLRFLTTESETWITSEHGRPR